MSAFRTGPGRNHTRSAKFAVESAKLAETPKGRPAKGGGRRRKLARGGSASYDASSSPDSRALMMRYIADWCYFGAAVLFLAGAFFNLLR